MEQGLDTTVTKFASSRRTNGRQQFSAAKDVARIPNSGPRRSGIPAPINTAADEPRMLLEPSQAGNMGRGSLSVPSSPVLGRGTAIPFAPASASKAKARKSLGTETRENVPLAHPASLKFNMGAPTPLRGGAQRLERHLPSPSVKRSHLVQPSPSRSARAGPSPSARGEMLPNTGTCGLPQSHIDRREPAELLPFPLEDFRLPLDSDLPHESPTVQVLVRIRPLNAREQASQGLFRCVRQTSATSLVFSEKQQDLVKRKGEVFTFDRVAGEGIPQGELYEVVGLPMVEHAFQGINSTLLAYGQTGSGKTYTMSGSGDWGEEGSTGQQGEWDDNGKGIIPRVLAEVLRRMREEEREREEEELCHGLYCSMLEVYNEKVYDLLDDTRPTLDVREDPRRGIVVVGLKEVEIRSPEEAQRVLEQGAKNRRVGATKMNHESSRSHSVLTLTITSNWRSGEVQNRRVGRLNLVDLAGSEKQKDTGATGERLREASNINKSLSALGKVINDLVDLRSGGLQRKHVGYRSSQLTKLLKDSLGGNCRAMVLACISPAMLSAKETMSTLKFAQRAKMMPNKVEANVQVMGGELALREEVKRLQVENAKLRNILDLKGPEHTLSFSPLDGRPSSESKARRGSAEGWLGRTSAVLGLETPEEPNPSQYADPGTEGKALSRVVEECSQDLAREENEGESENEAESEASCGPESSFDSAHFRQESLKPTVLEAALAAAAADVDLFTTPKTGGRRILEATSSCSKPGSRGQAEAAAAAAAQREADAAKERARLAEKELACLRALLESALKEAGEARAEADAAREESRMKGEEAQEAQRKTESLVAQERELRMQAQQEHWALVASEQEMRGVNASLLEALGEAKTLKLEIEALSRRSLDDSSRDRSQGDEGDEAEMSSACALHRLREELHQALDQVSSLRDVGQGDDSKPGSEGERHAGIPVTEQELEVAQAEAAALRETVARVTREASDAEFSLASAQEQLIIRGEELQQAEEERRLLREELSGVGNQLEEARSLLASLQEQVSMQGEDLLQTQAELREMREEALWAGRAADEARNKLALLEEQAYVRKKELHLAQGEAAQLKRENESAKAELDALAEALRAAHLGGPEGRKESLEGGVAYFSPQQSSLAQSAEPENSTSAGGSTYTAAEPAAIEEFSTPVKEEGEGDEAESAGEGGSQQAESTSEGGEIIHRRTRVLGRALTEAKKVQNLEDRYREQVQLAQEEAELAWDEAVRAREEAVASKRDASAAWQEVKELRGKLEEAMATWAVEEEVEVEVTQTEPQEDVRVELPKNTGQVSPSLEDQEKARNTQPEVGAPMQLTAQTGASGAQKGRGGEQGRMRQKGVKPLHTLPDQQTLEAGSTADSDGEGQLAAELAQLAESVLKQARRVMQVAAKVMREQDTREKAGVVRSAARQGSELDAWGEEIKLLLQGLEKIEAMVKAVKKAGKKRAVQGVGRRASALKAAQQGSLASQLDASKGESDVTSGGAVKAEFSKEGAEGASFSVAQAVSALGGEHSAWATPAQSQAHSHSNVEDEWAECVQGQQDGDAPSGQGQDEGEGPATGGCSTVVTGEGGSGIRKSVGEGGSCASGDGESEGDNEAGSDAHETGGPAQTEPSMYVDPEVGVVQVGKGECVDGEGGSAEGSDVAGQEHEAEEESEGEGGLERGEEAESDDEREKDDEECGEEDESGIVEVWGLDIEAEEEEEEEEEGEDQSCAMSDGEESQLSGKSIDLDSESEEGEEEEVEEEGGEDDMDSDLSGFIVPDEEEEEEEEDGGRFIDDDEGSVGEVGHAGEQEDSVGEMEHDEEGVEYLEDEVEEEVEGMGEQGGQSSPGEKQMGHTSAQASFRTAGGGNSAAEGSSATRSRARTSFISVIGGVQPSRNATENEEKEGKESHEDEGEHPSPKPAAERQSGAGAHAERGREETSGEGEKQALPQGSIEKVSRLASAVADRASGSQQQGTRDVDPKPRVQDRRCWEEEEEEDEEGMGEQRFADAADDAWSCCQEGDGGNVPLCPRSGPQHQHPREQGDIQGLEEDVASCNIGTASPRDKKTKKVRPSGIAKKLQYLTQSKPAAQDERVPSARQLQRRQAASNSTGTSLTSTGSLSDTPSSSGTSEVEELTEKKARRQRVSAKRDSGEPYDYAPPSRAPAFGWALRTPKQAQEQICTRGGKRPVSGFIGVSCARGKEAVGPWIGKYDGVHVGKWETKEEAAFIMESVWYLLGGGKIVQYAFLSAQHRKIIDEAFPSEGWNEGQIREWADYFLKKRVPRFRRSTSHKARVSFWEVWCIENLQ